MILLFLLSFLLAFYCLLIFYYRWVWKKIPHYTTPPVYTPVTKITVIVPARNEEKNIRKCLESLLVQDYPRELLEIIIVDDHSTDQTAEIISGYTDKGIRMISLKDESNQPGSKKKALTSGIQSAEGTLIITTDADCTFPVKWISTIASFYETFRPVFIAAPVTFSKEHTFLHIFQSLDFLSLQGITAASVFSRFHTMCNGANLAYEKKVFEEVNGFSGIDQVASGDDMLLMHKIYLQYPEKVMYCLSPDTIVETKPAENLRAFLNQRIRWASKALVYHDKRIFFVLLLVYLLNFSLLGLFLFGLFSFKMMLSCILFIAIKTIVELVFLYPVAAFYKKTSLLWLFPLAQPLHILYTVIAGFLGQSGTYEWKGRKLK